MLSILVAFGTLSCLSAGGYASSHHLGHQHHHVARHREVESATWEEHLMSRDLTTPVPSNNGSSDVNAPDVDVVTLIDDLVSTWLKNDPELNGSESQRTKLLETAERLKKGLLNPPSKRSTDPPSQKLKYERRDTIYYRQVLANSTVAGNSTIDKAREIVRRAQEEANARNVERLKNPRLNHYFAKDAMNTSQRKRALDASLLQINETVAAAAALVAEADADKGEFQSAALQYLKKQNPKRDLQKRAGTYWMEHIERTGKFPYGGSANNDYKVFRNVMDYGAKGNGKDDDTAAINRAMSEGNRCGANCGASTFKGAIVYFPPGTYLISSSIEAYYNTQMVGDANQFPVLLAAPSFVGLGVVSSDKYIEGGDGGQWYINQNNFLRQMRNFMIDVSLASMIDIAGLHWQVAQATSLQNIYFFQSSAADKKHIGIFAENGSGGFMSDLIFVGGAIGMQCGNQQFTTRGLTFINTKTAIDMLWDWGWTWKSLTIIGAEYGIKVAGNYNGGSILVLDSYFSSTTIGIGVFTPVGSNAQQHFSINIDNLVLNGVSAAVLDWMAGVVLDGGSKTIDSWILGKVYDTANPTGKYVTGAGLASPKPKTAALLGGPQGGYFEKSKPQYQSLAAGDFLNANIVAKGNAVEDDTLALNLLALFGAAAGRVIFMPAGSYIVTDTIKFPVGTKIVGECWSQIVAKGSRFSNISDPHVMVQVGQSGDSGVVEIQDLMFTQEGSTAGAVLMEWNIAATQAGSASMWDSHFRIGGARGSKLQVADCPKLTNRVNPNCIAGAMLLHMTASSSGYLENIWAWVADHDFDSGPAQTQIDIYVARGMLIETKQPTWLYATASEHCILYQYQFLQVKDLYMGMIQTESPYFLPKPQAPAPFTSAVGQFPNDPKFDDCPASDIYCKAAWGVRLLGSRNVHIMGAGLYNWFQDYIQPCVPAQNCQRRVVEVVGSSLVYWYNLYTIGTVEMVNAKGRDAITAKSNTNQNEHPFTSIINAWLLSAGDRAPDVPELPKCTKFYGDIDSIEKDKANIAEHCMNYYIARVLLMAGKKAIEDYEKLLRDDYQKKFDYYAEYILDFATPMIEEFMTTNASNYFDCHETYYRKCCSECNSSADCAGCGVPPNCGSYVERKMEKCPTRIPKDSANAGRPNEVRYELQSGKGDPFKGDLMQYQGVEPDWWFFSKLFIFSFKVGTPLPPNCCPSCTNPEQTAGCALFYYNYPLVDQKAKINDPEDVFTDALPKLKKFLENLEVAVNELYDQTFVGNTADVVRGAQMQVALIIQGVDNMNEIVAASSTIAEIKKQEQIALIVTMITALIGFVPFAGNAIRLAGLLRVGRTITYLGEMTQVGLNLYSFQSDPTNGGNLLWVMVDLVSIYIPRWNAAANAFKSMKDTYKYVGLNPRELLRAEGIDRIIIPNFRFFGI